MGDTSEVFRGFVFTHRNLLPSVWKALRDHRLPAAGATAWEDPSARCPRKRARGGSAGLAPLAHPRTSSSPTGRTRTPARSPHGNIPQPSSSPRPGSSTASPANPRRLRPSRHRHQPRHPPRIRRRASPLARPPPTMTSSPRPSQLDPRRTRVQPRVRRVRRRSTGRSRGRDDGFRGAVSSLSTATATASLNEPVVALLVELERYEHLGGGTAAQRADDLDAPATRDGGFNEEQSAYARAAAATRAWPRRLKPGDSRRRFARVTVRGRVPRGADIADARDGNVRKARGVQKGRDARRNRATSRRARAFRGRGARIGNGRGGTRIGNGRGTRIGKDASREDAPGALTIASSAVVVAGSAPNPAVVVSHTSRGREPGTLDEAAAHASLRVIPGVGRETARRLILAGFRDRGRFARGPRARRGGFRRATPRSSRRATNRGGGTLRGSRRAGARGGRGGDARGDPRGGSIRNVPGADPPGWEVTQVGGGRRSRASHDADFLVSHPKLRTHASMSGALRGTLDGLGDRLLSDASAFRMVSVDRTRRKFGDAFGIPRGR